MDKKNYNFKFLFYKPAKELSSSDISNIILNFIYNPNIFFVQIQILLKIWNEKKRKKIKFSVLDQKNFCCVHFAHSINEKISKFNLVNNMISIRDGKLHPRIFHLFMNIKKLFFLTSMRRDFYSMINWILGEILGSYEANDRSLIKYWKERRKKVRIFFWILFVDVTQSHWINSFLWHFWR